MDRVRNCCVCLMRNFGHWASEMTLVIVKFRFVPKVRRNSVLCSREISLQRPWIVTRTFAWTFLESSRKQRTKFAHFACVTFAQYCRSFSFKWTAGRPSLVSSPTCSSTMLLSSEITRTLAFRFEHCFAKQNTWYIKLFPKTSRGHHRVWLQGNYFRNWARQTVLEN